MKRIFDLTFSIIAFFVFAIPILIIILIIKFISKHPVIFKQNRIGYHKHNFEIYKFQTMVNEKVTPFGAILRKTGIDELPQFVNVFKGDMSIVGPRAITEFDIKRLGWDTEYYSKRWNVKPGISGYAQIYGGQNKKTSWFWDMKYVSKSGIITDFSIIFISFLMNLFGKKRIRNIIWPHKKLK